jgi:hypothetical protein
VAKNRGYKNAVVVLAVFLAIAIAIAILMAVLAGKDCMAHAVAKQKQLAEHRASCGRTNSLMIRPRHQYDDSQQLTQNANDSLSEINVETQPPQSYEDRPRQRGRRAERDSKGPAPQILVEEDRGSDSGMSSANASTQGANSHPVHAHQDSGSSSSSQQAFRPKQSNSVYYPPQNSMYGAREDLSSGYATPYQHPVSPRSVQSEGDIGNSPAPTAPPRAAHTDVRLKNKNPGSQGYFTNPKKLEFQDNNMNGHVQVHREDGGAYVDSGSTVI